MNDRPRATVVAALICVVWGIATAVIGGAALARLEYARAALEARAVAASLDSNLTSGRAPTRDLMAQGRIRPVVLQMERWLGSKAQRLASEERVLVHAAGWERYVSVPVKDASQWDVVGAVVLRTRWLQGIGWPLTALGALTLMAVLLAVRRLRRIAADKTSHPWWQIVDVAACLALGMVGAAILVRQRIDAALVTFPAETARLRFDPLYLAPPDGQVVAILLMIAMLTASAGLLMTAWVASGQRTPADRRTTLAAWGFLAPSALHLFVFTLGPLVFTLYLSLHDWDLLEMQRPFVGLGNYRELLADPLFWTALRNTALYSLYVPVTMLLALGAALLLNQPLRGVRILRALVFIPTVVSYVAIAMVWQWMYHADYGLINYIIRFFGGTGSDWLGNPSTALIAVMIVSAWVQLGYQMIVYLAGLQGIPEHLHEAARLDGARAWQRFRFVTWPLLRPVSLFLFITGVIWSFQVFALVYVMTEGGPLHATDVLVYQIYQQAFEFRRMGYASAMSWVLFAILAGLTFAQWRLLNRRVEHAA